MSNFKTLTRTDFLVSMMATNHIRLMNDHLVCTADARQVFAMVSVAISK